MPLAIRPIHNHNPIQTDPSFALPQLQKIHKTNYWNDNRSVSACEQRTTVKLCQQLWVGLAWSAPYLHWNTNLTQPDMEAFTYLIPRNSKRQNSQTEHKQVCKDHHNIQRCHHCKNDRFYYKLLTVFAYQTTLFIHQSPSKLLYKQIEAMETST